MVPHHLHEPVALEVLDAGLHLLLEKPMAPTPDACERILRAAAAALRDLAHDKPKNATSAEGSSETEEAGNQGA